MEASRGTAQNPTPYIVLFQLPEQSGQGWSVLGSENGDDDFIVTSRGAEQAIRDALKLSPTLKGMAESEAGVTVLPVPQRSYKPVPVRLVPQAPVIKIG